MARVDYNNCFTPSSSIAITLTALLITTQQMVPLNCFVCKLVQNDSFLILIGGICQQSALQTLPHKHLGEEELWGMFAFHCRVSARLSFELKKWDHERTFAKNTLLCKQKPWAYIDMASLTHKYHKENKSDSWYWVASGISELREH